MKTLKTWLDYIYAIHPIEVELGLHRVHGVAERLGVLKKNCPVIIVGGTNGKGSTVLGLEKIYLTAGYQVGAFTSPFLFQHNEQVRVNGCVASDECFCDAFEKIEIARKEVSLTIFEFNTLAALLIFQKHDLDVLILEVGLGGRLDAVNIIDADVSVVTSIALDHMDRLGGTREKIGFEKAGIFRANKPAVCGCFYPPQSLINYVNKMGAIAYYQNHDFWFKEYETTWSWFSRERVYHHLPFNALYIQNLSTILMAITALQKYLPVSENAIKAGLEKSALVGRFEITTVNKRTVIYDVAHNPAAMLLLKENLLKQTCYGKTSAVFSMLADKDIAGCVKALKAVIDHWHIAPIDYHRAASASILKETLNNEEILAVTDYDSIVSAFDSALKILTPNDRLIVCGSFHTVAAARIAREHISV